MPTKKTTELMIDEHTKADVIETVNADGKTTKRISYPAIIKENETKETESNIVDSETELQSDYFETYREVQEIPKDKIDLFFDDVREVLQNENDSFYIRLSRLPDGFDDNFSYRCADVMPLGLFNCYLRDEFRIVELIQKKNNNSGGRFNLIALDRSQKVLEIIVGQEFDNVLRKRVPITSPIIARDVLIPNPMILEHKQETNSNSAIADAFIKLGEMQQQSTNAILQAIRENNQPKEKSTIEKAIEQKIINDIANPKPQAENSFEEKMLTIFAMPQMVEKMANKMFPENIANTATEQGLLDKILNNETIMTKGFEVIQSVGGMAANLAAMKMQQQTIEQQATPNPQTNSQPIQQTTHEQLPEPQEVINESVMKQQELVEKILTELKTTNPINESNTVLSELKTEYANIYPLIQGACKAYEFKDVLNTLENLVDFNEIGLLDDEDFNEVGLHVKARLREFYELMRK